MENDISDREFLFAWAGYCIGYGKASGDLKGSFEIFMKRALQMRFSVEEATKVLQDLQASINETVKELKGEDKKEP